MIGLFAKEINYENPKAMREIEESLKKEKPLSIKFDGYEFVLWFKDNLIVTIGDKVCYELCELPIIETELKELI